MAIISAWSFLVYTPCHLSAIKVIKMLTQMLALYKKEFRIFSQINYAIKRTNKSNNNNR